MPVDTMISGLDNGVYAISTTKKNAGNAKNLYVIYILAIYSLNTSVFPLRTPVAEHIKWRAVSAAEIPRKASVMTDRADISPGMRSEQEAM